MTIDDKHRPILLEVLDIELKALKQLMRLTDGDDRKALQKRAHAARSAIVAIKTA